MRAPIQFVGRINIIIKDVNIITGNYSINISSDYRWQTQKEETHEGNSQKFGKILQLFLDERDHTYSIHQIGRSTRHLLNLHAR